MRKKLFAVIMSAMMMITFMPSMAFAVEPATTNPYFSDSVVSGDAWTNVKYDPLNYYPNTEDVLEGFRILRMMLVGVRDNPGTMKQVGAAFRVAEQPAYRGKQRHRTDDNDNSLHDLLLGTDTLSGERQQNS